jgi:hypothetical protein
MIASVLKPGKTEPGFSPVSPNRVPWLDTPANPHGTNELSVVTIGGSGPGMTGCATARPGIGHLLHPSHLAGDAQGRVALPLPDDVAIGRKFEPSGLKQLTVILFQFDKTIF